MIYFINDSQYIAKGQSSKPTLTTMPKRQARSYGSQSTYSAHSVAQYNIKYKQMCK